uniref:Uncharacterized protein n=1 Tax=Octopus bimaculoides TaxID=37653 RepID=A0A0L8GC77_OCTBM
MDDHRIPKQLLYGELAQGKRPRGRPKLKYKGTCKTSLSKCEVDDGTWEERAEDRTTWRTVVKEGTASLESSYRNKQVEKRQRRKENNRNADRRATLLVFQCSVEWNINPRYVKANLNLYLCCQYFTETNIHHIIKPSCHEISIANS